MEQQQEKLQLNKTKFKLGLDKECIHLHHLV